MSNPELGSEEPAPDRPEAGPLGDVRPKPGDPAPTRGGQKQERVEDRPNVGTVTPDDYTEDQKAKG